MSAGYLAVDLGAESGRGVLGRFDGAMSLEEVHRFPNGPVRLPDGLHWDVLRILHEIKDGLARPCGERGRSRASGSTPGAWTSASWTATERSCQPVPLPRPAHRGHHGAGLRRVPKEEIFATTGIQFMPFNTLYQLLAMRGSPLLGAARDAAPDPRPVPLLAHRREGCEYTNASTTQLSTATGRLGSGLLEGWVSPPGLRGDRAAGHAARVRCCPRSPRRRVGAGRARYGGRLPRHGLGRRRRARGGDDFAYITSGTWSLWASSSPAPHYARRRCAPTSPTRAASAARCAS